MWIPKCEPKRNGSQIPVQGNGAAAGGPDERQVLDTRRGRPLIRRVCFVVPSL